MTKSFPLTPIQEAMFGASHLAARPWLYVEQVVVDMPGERLDAQAMQAAWRDLAMVLPVLRSRIVAEDGQLPVQQVSADVDVPGSVEDFAALSADKAEAAFDAFLAKDRQRGIDATAAPGFRVTLFDMGAAGSKLVWTFPHTLLDGRSFAPLLAEAFERYEAICAGTADPVELTHATPRFAQHCTTLGEMAHAEGTQHFATALKGWEGGEGLVRYGVEPGRKRFVDRRLTAEETAAIARIAQRTGGAVSTVVMLAWGVVTARLAGRDDTVFGNTLNGRNLIPGAADAPGCFIVTVPIRLHLSRDLTLGTALKRMRANQIALRPFEQTPLASIRQHLDVPPGRAIYDTLVMFARASLHSQMQMRGVEIGETNLTDQSLFSQLGHLVQCVQPGGMFKAPPMELQKINFVDTQTVQTFLHPRAHHISGHWPGSRAPFGADRGFGAVR